MRLHGQVWLAKLRPEQPSAFSSAVVLTLAGVPGFQAPAFAMLKVPPANRAHNLPPNPTLSAKQMHGMEAWHCACSACACLHSPWLMASDGDHELPCTFC